MSRNNFADEAEFADLNDFVHLRRRPCRRPLTVGPLMRAPPGWMGLRHSCDTSSRLIFFGERSVSGNLPAQFRPETFQPRRQPVVPNPNPGGILHNYSAAGHRRIGGNRGFNGERPAAAQFPRPVCLQTSVFSGGKFQDKIRFPASGECFGGEGNDGL